MTGGWAGPGLPLTPGRPSTPSGSWLPFRGLLGPLWPAPELIVPAQQGGIWPGRGLALREEGEVARIPACRAQGTGGGGGGATAVTHAGKATDLPECRTQVSQGSPIPHYTAPSHPLDLPETCPPPPPAGDLQ